MTAVPPRLAQILGPSIDDLTETDLTRLIGVREDDDLDFKEALYGSSDGDKAELAADVVSFASTRGGLIVIGVKESAGEAVELVPVVLPAAEEELRIQQIVAARVVPAVRVVTRVVASGAHEGKAYLLIAVPRSPSSPHATRDGDNRLRYLVRSGPGKRSLSESEVADGYARRARGIVEQAERGRSIASECLAHADRAMGAWLSVALVPDLPGSMELNVAAPRQIAQWFTERRADLLPSSLLSSEALRPSTNVQRVVLSSYRRKESPFVASARFALHTDGAGGGTVAIGHARSNERIDPLDFEQAVPDRFAIINDETLVFETANVVAVLARHAIENAGASGTARLLARIDPMHDALGPMPSLLYHYRGVMGGGPVSGAFVVEVETEHTVDLTEVATPGAAQLVATRFILLDLFAGFGFPEPFQISSDGKLRRRYVGTWTTATERWAAAHDVELIDEAIT